MFMENITKHHGSCHCGAVRFEVALPAEPVMARCNCSICTKLGATGTICQPDAFELVTGADALGSYAWGAKISTRYFCARCGVYLFGRGHLAELGGDFVSVNCNTLEDIEPSEWKVIYWDGRHNNWHAGPRDRPYPIAAK